MLTISYYFLGLAICIFAVLACFATGKRAGKKVDVDLDALHAASVCLSMSGKPVDDGITKAIYKDLAWDQKAKLSNTRAFWKQWYERCKQKAILKQKAMYSWARTLALCAALCLIGVLLEAEFDQPLTIRNVLAGFKRPCPVTNTTFKSCTPSCPAPLTPKTGPSASK